MRHFFIIFNFGFQLILRRLKIKLYFLVLLILMNLDVQHICYVGIAMYEFHSHQINPDEKG